MFENDSSLYEIIPSMKSLQSQIVGEINETIDSDKNDANSNGDETIENVEKVKTTDVGRVTNPDKPYVSMYGSHRVKSSLQQLPKWLSDYVAWHREQRANINDDTRYLVVLLLKADKGSKAGFSDRLRAFPFMLLAGYKTNRVVCIYWATPFRLESLLQPPEGGLDWRCPAEVDDFIDPKMSSVMQKKIRYQGMFWNFEGEPKKVAERVITRLKKSDDKYHALGLYHYGFGSINSLNNIFNAYSYEDIYPGAHKWHHIDLMEHIFRVLFEPIDVIARNINQTMTSLGECAERICHAYTRRFILTCHHCNLNNSSLQLKGLIEGQYTSVHVRARYPVARLKRIFGKDPQHHDKGAKHPFEGKYKKYLLGVTTNSLKCGTQLDPESKVFFSSDSADLTKHVITEAVDHEGKPFEYNGKVYKPVGHEQREHIKHLGGSKQVDEEDFYPLVEDLMILGGSKCVAYGIGSFGAFGAALSGNRCAMIHRDHKGSGVPCPNDRAKKVMLNVTDNLLFDDKASPEDGRIKFLANDYYALRKIVKAAENIDEVERDAQHKEKMTKTKVAKGTKKTH